MPKKSVSTPNNVKDITIDVFNKKKMEIVRGFKESVEDFQKALQEVDPQEIMQFVLMTQYFDTLTSIGANENNNTVMVPHTPGGMKDFQQQIIEGTFVGRELSSG